MSSEKVPLVDVLIVGGGYAGLAAASTLYRATHSSIVFDSGVFRDAKGASIRLLPGWEGVDSSDYRAAAREELTKTGLCSVVYAGVSEIQGTDGMWTAIATDGEQYSGRKIILATGSDEIYPSIPGYGDCWVTGIFPCMYQFGYEQRGSSSAGILVVDKLAGLLPQVLKLAGDTHKFARSVVLYTNGNRAAAEELEALVQKANLPFVVEGERIARLVKLPTDAAVEVELEDGSRRTEGFLVHQPWTKLRGSLPIQLGLETTPMGDIKVQHPFPLTSVPGVYAAGDCASPFKNASMAIASGVCAGNGVARELPSSFAK
ncbi:FAD/NAD(P)-binding domain-containing protein [Aspergillus floccosus]